MKAIHTIAFILVVVGAINWGLVGINESWNLVDLLLGKLPMVERIVYILVGLSGLSLVFSHKKDCKACESKTDAPSAM
jgi:hypothetical protein